MNCSLFGLPIIIGLAASRKRLQSLVYQISSGYEQSLYVSNLLVLWGLSEESTNKVEAFLRNTAQMNLLRMPPLETLCCDYHEDICQQIDHNLAQLILEVTQRCNFRCKYCIYNSSYEGNHDFSAANMSWDTAKQAIDYLFAHSAERKNIYLTFYGGEPLLQFDLIKQATLYAQNLATQESRNLYFNLTTNPRYWDLGSYDPLAKWQLTQAIRHSLSWDSTNNLFSYGYSHYDWGDCGASCADGNSANMNANVATAISRATDG